MIISNEQARELLELDVGDTTTDWGNSHGADPGSYPLNFECVLKELVDTSRWSTIHEVVYKDLETGKFYESSYRKGATESQDERPYEYDGAEIELCEVVPRETITIKYVAV